MDSPALFTLAWQPSMLSFRRYSLSSRYRLQYFHLIVIHDTQISLLEGFCHSLWHFGLGFDDLRLHFLGIGAHFLLLGDGHGTAFFGSCLCDLLICFCLIGLELGADISDIDIGDIDGKDFKSCP